MRTTLLRTLAVVGATTIGAASAQAAPITFFGEDLNGAELRIAHPNADAARSAFLSRLIGVGTETFESFAGGVGPTITVTFPGAGTASLINGGPTRDTPVGTNGFGRYPISGDVWYEANALEFRLFFGTPIAAFGFYGVDVGDFAGAVSLTLEDLSGNTSSLSVGNTVAPQSNGAVLYFGFYDRQTQYRSITFTNNNLDDFFGFDDFTVGSLDQIRQSAPEPMSLALFGLGIVALAARLRSKKA